MLLLTLFFLFDYLFFKFLSKYYAHSIDTHITSHISVKKELKEPQTKSSIHISKVKYALFSCGHTENGTIAEHGYSKQKVANPHK